MKNLTKLALASLSLLGMATAAAPAAYAQAAAPAPDWTASATVDVQSDYRFRGISQSHKNPVPQGALNITGPDGFYGHLDFADQLAGRRQQQSPHRVGHLRRQAFRPGRQLGLQCGSL